MQCSYMGKLAAYCKFRMLNPCLHTGSQSLVPSALSPWRMSRGSSGSPRTSRRAWEQLRSHFVWGARSAQPQRHKMCEPTKEPHKVQCQLLLISTEQPQLPNSHTTGYFICSSASFFSRGEKSGRGFSWEQGLSPHPTTDRPWAHAPQNCFTLPSRIRISGKRRTSAHTTSFSSSLPVLKARGGSGIISCRVTPSTPCRSSLSPRNAAPGELLMLYKAINEIQEPS